MNQLSEPSTSKAEKEVHDEKNRLYNDSYLVMGFTWARDENCPLPLCTVYGKKTIKYGYSLGKVKLTLHY
jgi:hypothetical protein